MAKPRPPGNVRAAKIKNAPHGHLVSSLHSNKTTVSVETSLVASLSAENHCGPVAVFAEEEDRDVATAQDECESPAEVDIGNCLRPSAIAEIDRQVRKVAHFTADIKDKEHLKGLAVEKLPVPPNIIADEVTAGHRKVKAETIDKYAAPPPPENPLYSWPARVHAEQAALDASHWMRVPGQLKPKDKTDKPRKWILKNGPPPSPPRPPLPKPERPIEPREPVPCPKAPDTANEFTFIPPASALSRWKPDVKPTSSMADLSFAMKLDPPLAMAPFILATSSANIKRFGNIAASPPSSFDAAQKHLKVKGASQRTSAQRPDGVKVDLFAYLKEIDILSAKQAPELGRFPCRHLHAANVVEGFHHISRYCVEDAFTGMQLEQPLALNVWNQVPKDQTYTLGNGIVLTGGCKYMRIQGTYGCAINVEGIIIVGISDAGTTSSKALITPTIWGEEQPEGTSTDDPTYSLVPAIGAPFRMQQLDVVSVDVLPTLATKPYPIHYFQTRTVLGNIIPLKGSYLDSEMIIHGPFIYKAVRLGANAMIHADGTFAKLSSKGKKEIFDKEKLKSRWKSKNEFGKKRKAMMYTRLSRGPPPEILALDSDDEGGEQSADDKVYVEFCMDRLLHVIVQREDDPPALDCYGYHFTVLPHAFRLALQRPIDFCHPNHIRSEKVLDRTQERRCGYCGAMGTRAAMRACSRCHCVYLCSKECQVPHWKEGHKAWCTGVKEWLGGAQERCAKRVAGYSFEDIDVVFGTDKAADEDVKTLCRKLQVIRKTNHLLLTDQQKVPSKGVPAVCEDKPIAGDEALSRVTLEFPQQSSLQSIPPSNTMTDEQKLCGVRQRCFAQPLAMPGTNPEKSVRVKRHGKVETLSFEPRGLKFGAFSSEDEKTGDDRAKPKQSHSVGRSILNMFGRSPLQRAVPTSKA
ncbi:hypothetical protein BC832DRAFT_589549 [Gaertneriomyces semiglobifer]|nr:hypothetical protein BC832DRAFT_589549 [Gaertneriomyces semiglobifer]